MHEVISDKKKPSSLLEEKEQEKNKTRQNEGEGEQGFRYFSLLLLIIVDDGSILYFLAKLDYYFYSNPISIQAQ